MAQLTYKPRPKMHEWAPPLPPKPRRSRFYFWAVLVWLVATAGMYHWLAREAPGGAPAEDRMPVKRNDVPVTVPEARTPTASKVPTRAMLRREPEGPNAASASNESSPEDATDAVPSDPRRAAGVEQRILPCEEFLQSASQAADNRLPLHLGRSAIDVFIGDNEWAKPCRTTQRRSVALCVAIRDGAVVGLSARTSPLNLTLENCLREQAAKLSLPAEETLRVFRTNARL